MNMTKYSYVILKYRHDFTAGEVLNIGLVMFAHETGQVGVLTSSTYSRLSKTFAHFDGNQHREVLNRISSQIEAAGIRMTEGVLQPLERAKYVDAFQLVRSVWPDQGLSYFASLSSYGICENFEKELTELYDRFVLSQQDERAITERYDDDAVWRKLNRVLTEKGIHLEPVSLGPAEIQFEHAYKNGKWHIIEPISLDYVNPASIKERALNTVGKSVAMSNVAEFGTMNLIIARPSRTEHNRQFEIAVELLKQIRVKHKIVFEEDVEDFAATMEQQIHEHGLLHRQKLA